MLGIPGLDPFGLVHAGLGLVALALGLVVLLRPKGEVLHRVCGTAYAGTMLLLNGSALVIYDFNGRFNVFHALAIVNLATLAAGWVAALRRAPARVWYRRHAMFMAWSYVGLVAAFVSEIAVRLPFVRRGPTLGITVAVASFAVVAAGAEVIRRRMPAAVTRVAAR
jgi:uncharacterized membrane protein